MSDTAKDWPEDFSHENGNYQCLCSSCGGTFIGHKRRGTCKGCAGPTSQRDAGPAYAHYNGDDRRKIVTLQRRAEWLRLRIDGNHLDHDRRELAALEWALGRLAQST